jgi:SAM-dependent methyltransferase
MNFSKIKDKIKNYYSEKILLYGSTFKGVDWNSEKTQILRFEQILKVCREKSCFTINDLGCGYGAMFKYMNHMGYNFIYKGYDLSEDMIVKAKELFSPYNNCNFICSDELQNADYTVSSGIFNVMTDVSHYEWEEYILAAINSMNNSSMKGFSFNILTKYSDRDYMKDYLYYGDPSFFFDYCKRNFSKNVALLHDYDLYEFTILVRKEVTV